MYIMYRLSIYSNVLKYFMETWLFYLKKKNSLNVNPSTEQYQVLFKSYTKTFTSKKV